MSPYLPALLLGFLGSFHCVVMCSPLMLALPFRRVNSLSVFYNGVVYQLGRILSYVLIGQVFFLLGKSFEMTLLQNSLAWLAGVALILFGVGQMIPAMRSYFSGFFLVFVTLVFLTN